MIGWLSMTAGYIKALVVAYRQPADLLIKGCEAVWNPWIKEDVMMVAKQKDSWLIAVIAVVAVIVGYIYALLSSPYAIIHW